MVQFDEVQLDRGEIRWAKSGFSTDRTLTW